MSTVERFFVAAYSSTSSLATEFVRPSRLCDRIVRQAILHLDRILRRSLAIFEFSGDPECILRIALIRAKVESELPNGARICRGDSVLDLHLWNERVRALLADGSPLARGRSITRCLRRSFELLAEYMTSSPEMTKVQIVHARVAMPIGDRFSKFEELARMYGFSVTASSAGGLTRLHNYFENYLVHALMWSFNPSRTIRMARSLERLELWIDRDQYLERYGKFNLSSEHRAARGASRHEVQACSLSPSDDSECVGSRTW
jgi:hypothetical protein